MIDPRALKELAEQLARTAGALTLTMRAEASSNPDTKSSVGDLVTAADHTSEALIVTGLTQARPNDAIVGEEGADRPGSSGVRWLIDPIDGTTNYVYDLPGYSVSIAAQLDGRTIAGVVYDPRADECFAAHHGGGATRNGEPLACSHRNRLAESVLGTGFGYSPEQRLHQAEVLLRVLPAIANLRRLGSAALDLAYVGAGRLDGYWELGLNDWDSAAGALVATESGALVTDLEGGPPGRAMTVAAPPALHAELVELLLRGVRA